MPTPVLIVLIVLVGAYVIVAGIASLGFVLARRENPPPAPSEWPSVSVVVPAAEASARETVQQIQDCDYPSDRLEFLVSSDDPDGEIVLTAPAGGTPDSEWIRTMARRCTPDTPVVVGPTVVEHEGLFLPRLQALAHLGRLAFTAGTSHLGLPSPAEASNRAVRVDARSPDDASGEMPREGAPAFNLEPEALVARPAVESFAALLRRLAGGFQDVFRSSSWLVRAQGIGLWLLHSVLLACALVAVAVPAWRQPTLLALVATMGANVVLALPAAKHYGQRGLLRSVVPTVLMLVLALPVAGLWAVTLPSSSQDPEPKSS